MLRARFGSLSGRGAGQGSQRLLPLYGCVHADAITPTLLTMLVVCARRRRARQCTQLEGHAPSEIPYEIATLPPPRRSKAKLSLQLRAETVRVQEPRKQSNLDAPCCNVWHNLVVRPTNIYLELHRVLLRSRAVYLLQLGVHRFQQSEAFVSWLRRDDGRRV
jgi:hypothetical protein